MRQRQIWPEYSSHLSDTLGQVRVVGRENGHISVTRECHTPLLPKFACLCLVSKMVLPKVALVMTKNKTPWICMHPRVPLQKLCPRNTDFIHLAAGGRAATCAKLLTPSGRWESHKQCCTTCTYGCQNAHVRIVILRSECWVQ
jgi:hypothetical protein